MTTATLKDCTISVEPDYDDESIIGNASAIDNVTDKKIEDFIRNELDNGNGV